MASLGAAGIALLVEEILSAISAVGPLGVELFLKLESLFQLGPDEQANVAAAIKAGLAADAETIAAVEGVEEAGGGVGLFGFRGFGLLTGSLWIGDCRSGELGSGRAEPVGRDA